jgi:purine nucleoside permease
MKRAALLLLATCHHVSGTAPTDSSSASDGGSAGRAIKVMIVDMFSLEGAPIVSALGLTQQLSINGVTVSCNSDDVCELVTGMGYANAAASMTAVIYNRQQLDLGHTYFVIGGIAGIDPTQGTIGTAAWAHYAVDFGFSNELDAREMPSGWPYGYFGVGTTSPSSPPTGDYRGTFELDAGFLQAALAITKSVALEDSAMAMTVRANYPSPPANQPPVVTQCDVVSSDTWFAGTALAQRARDWMKLATNNAGTYCTSAQEDNATLEVLARGAAAGQLDFARVALLRTASDFSVPYPSQTDADALLGSLADGGLTPAVDNLAKTIAPLATAIVGDWSDWQNGPPAM